jgi:hypothetical protein
VGLLHLKQQFGESSNMLVSAKRRLLKCPDFPQLKQAFSCCRRSLSSTEICFNPDEVGRSPGDVVPDFEIALFFCMLSL